MSFILHNTLGGAKELVFAADSRTLRFYCCGPTVYGPAHIGNFRTFVVQDVFRRVAEAHGLATCHVRNLTDVDDKTIRQSQAEGTTLAAFCAHWTERFHRDCAALNLLPPHHEPSAVANIPEQLFLIDRLLERGHAYRAEDGSVYFNVASFPTYGRLSGLERRELRAGAVARETADEYSTREHAADFVLWKAHKPADGPNAWASPWGRGRPGWHIECSAMGMRYLGESFDLHSGGVDLIFPHHENEIAQSEAATGQTFVRHWLHVAHLLVDGGKMSKSLGNLYTLDDVEARGYTPSELRLALLSGHYRQPLNFTWNSLHAARAALTRIARLLATAPSDTKSAAATNFGVFEEVFTALSDDLNTPRAIGVLFSALEPFEKGRIPFTAYVAANLRAVLGVWGLVPPCLAATPVIVPPEIRALAEARQSARARCDWVQADALRAHLTAVGWELRESSAGYVLSPVSAESS